MDPTTALRNFAATLSSIAITVGLLGQALVLISPRFGARILALWEERKAVAEAEKNRWAEQHGKHLASTATLTSPPAAPSNQTSSSVTAVSTTATDSTNTSATTAAANTVDARETPAAPTQRAPTPAGVSAPVGTHAGTGFAELVYRRLTHLDPTHPTLYRSCVGLFAALILGGLFIDAASSNTDSFAWVLGVSLLLASLVTLYALGAWALTLAIRLRDRDWIVGLAIGLVVVGPFMPLVYALRGPALPQGAPIVRFPDTFKLTALTAASLLLGVIMLFVYDGTSTLLEIVGFLLLGWGYVTSVILAGWAVREAVMRRRIGWAIALVLLTIVGLYPLFILPWLGALLFTLNGPADLPAIALQPASALAGEQS